MTKFDGIVLALDLATTIGFAHGKPGSMPICGHLRLAVPGSSRALIYRALRGWLDHNRHRIKPALIVYESAAVPMVMQGHTRIETIRLLNGLCEHVEEWAYDQIELREASVSQVRNHFIGENPRASIAKPKIFNRCVELGWKVETHDESDAAALWDYQMSWLRPDLAHKTTPLFAK